MKIYKNYITKSNELNKVLLKLKKLKEKHKIDKVEQKVEQLQDQLKSCEAIVYQKMIEEKIESHSEFSKTHNFVWKIKETTRRIVDTAKLKEDELYFNYTKLAPMQRKSVTVVPLKSEESEDKDGK